MFVVYEHWRPDKGVCFYVGKGTKKRANMVIRRENIHHLRIVEKLKAAGHKVEVKIYWSGSSEDEAFAVEKERIAFWRSVSNDLCNITDGGEGASGYVASEETRRKIREKLTGIKRPYKPLSAEHKARISEGMKGRVVTQETRDKISMAQKGKPRPELIGRKLSAEGLAKLKNREFTEEHRRKISEGNKGKIRSEEVKQRISNSLKMMYANKNGGNDAKSC